MKAKNDDQKPTHSGFPSGGVISGGPYLVGIPNILSASCWRDKEMYRLYASQSWSLYSLFIITSQSANTMQSLTRSHFSPSISCIHSVLSNIPCNHRKN